MPPISARTARRQPGDGSSVALPAPHDRAKGGKPVPDRGLRATAGSPWIGSSDRRTVPKARSRLCGGRSVAIARASPIPLCASASRTAVPVPPQAVVLPDQRRPGAACICHRRSALKQCRRRAWYASEEGRQRYRCRTGRRDALARGAGLWPATDPVSGLRDPLTACRDRRRHQYQPPCRVARRAPTGPRRAPLVSPRSLRPAPYPLGHHLRRLPLTCLVL